jgi:flagellar hook assembly protein FlgD
VRIDVLDASGRRVRTLVEGERGAGRHFATWNARDERGHGVAAGVYLVELQSSNGRRTARVVVVP